VATVHRGLYGNDFLTRRHLYAVARNLGHSTPGTSTAVYLELQSELLALWLETESPMLEPKLIQALAGISPSRASEFRAAGARERLWKVAGERWETVAAERDFPSPAGDQARPIEKKLAIREQFEAVAPPQMLRVEQLLSASARGADLREIIRSSRCPEAFARELLRAANDAAELTVAHQSAAPTDHSQGYVHRFIRNDDGKRLVYPFPLRTAPETEVVKRLASAVYEYASANLKPFRLIAHHWLESRRDGRNGLEFLPWHARIAEQFLDLLGQIGVKPEQCFIFYFGSEQQVDEWKRLVHLSDAWWARLKHAGPSKVKAQDNVLGIKLLDPLADEGIGQSTSGIYAWRYLMLMASLWALASEASTSRKK
jgi:hypothetical protein